MSYEWLIKALIRDSIGAAAWLIAVVLSISLFNFMINDASIIAFVLMVGALQNNTAALGLVRSRRAEGRSPWGGIGGGLAFYMGVNVILAITFAVVCVLRPIYLWPFEPLAWQLPALQGYFTAIVAHFTTLAVLKGYDRIAGKS
jgi:hypothetical protein